MYDCGRDDEVRFTCFTSAKLQKLLTKSANTAVVVTIKSHGTLAATSAQVKHVSALTKPLLSLSSSGCDDEL